MYKKLIFTAPAIAAMIFASAVLATDVKITTNDSATTTIEQTTSSALPTNDTKIVGNDRDEHGCIGSAGYTRSATMNKCVRVREVNNLTGTTGGNTMPGGDRDEHGCIGSAGYTRSATMNKCVRVREEATKEKKEYKDAFHADYGYIRNYFSKLTDATARKERETSVTNAMNALLKSKSDLNTEFRASVKNNTQMDQATIDARVETMIKTFHDAVIKYIDTKKSAEFEAFMLGKQDMYKKLFTVNQLTWEKNQKSKQEGRDTKKEEKKAVKQEKKDAKVQVKSDTRKDSKQPQTKSTQE